MKAHRLVHPGKGRFWEVHWEGSQTETTSGALGTNGRSSAKSFASEREADRWVEEQLARRRKEGFTELTDPGSAVTSAAAQPSELLARILERPDDDALRSVYADELSAAGDPRGEFIQVQLALAKGGTPIHQHREKELLERFRVPWSQGLRGVDLRYERGFVTEMHLKFDDLEQYVGKLWQVAPLLTRLHVNAEYSSRVTMAVRELVKREELKGLTELHLNMVAWDSPQIVGALSSVKCFDALEKLALRRLGASDGELIELVTTERFPKLTRVDLRGNTLAGGAIDTLAKRPLVELNYSNNRLGQSSVAQLSRAKAWKTLRSLDLSGNGIGNAGLRVLGEAEFLGNVATLGLSDVQALTSGLQLMANGAIGKSIVELDLSDNELREEGARLLASGLFPALTTLDLSSAMLGDRGVAALLDGPMASRLTTLHLRKNQISAAGIRVLTKKTLPKLEHLRVSGNPLGEGGVDRVREALPGVQVVARA